MEEALKRAEEEQLDLVEIAPNAKPSVCKIIDYGKYVYEQQKRDKLQKKKQHVSPHVSVARLEYPAKTVDKTLAE